MWWCCGKTQKDQPGCKFRKHETKDDNEDDSLTQEEKDRERERMLRYARCMCCREIGHKMEDCVRDPNLKTLTDMVADNSRINKIKDYRKLYVDTLV